MQPQAPADPLMSPSRSCSDTIVRTPLAARPVVRTPLAATLARTPPAVRPIVHAPLRSERASPAVQPILRTSPKAERPSKPRDGSHRERTPHAARPIVRTPLESKRPILHTAQGRATANTAGQFPQGAHAARGTVNCAHTTQVGATIGATDSPRETSQAGGHEHANHLSSDQSLRRSPQADQG